LSALHSLENPKLSEKENREIFGPCYRLHGHDYKIEVTVEGPISEPWGLITDRAELDKKVDEILLRPFHLTNLNDTFSNTSGENLVQEFFKRLSAAVPNLRQIRLTETHRNFFIASN
jgi:6-pyruvoyltetrahydropterin/6-carboxytetrahydropterin synthase